MSWRSCLFGVSVGSEVPGSGFRSQDPTGRSDSLAQLHSAPQGELSSNGEHAALRKQQQSQNESPHPKFVFVIFLVKDP